MLELQWTIVADISLKKDKEDLEELTTELELADEDSLIP
jgi:hypothetical protein